MGDPGELCRDPLTPPCPPEHHSSSAHHGKHLIEDLIIESSKFPAAQPPDPNQPAKIETDYWPCPPSLAVVGRWHRRDLPPESPGRAGQGRNVPSVPAETEWRRRMASKRGEEEDEDLSEEMKNLRELQRQELSKVGGREGRWGRAGAGDALAATPTRVPWSPGHLQPREADPEGGDGEVAPDPEKNSLAAGPDTFSHV